MLILVILLVTPRLVDKWSGAKIIRTVGRQEIVCKAPILVELKMHGVRIKKTVITTDYTINDIDMVIGMDMIDKSGKSEFPINLCAVNIPEGIDRCPRMQKVTIEINGKDFSAVFDREKWAVEWTWKEEAQY